VAILLRAMAHRSPARWLAPLALVAAALAIVVVASSSGGSGGAGSSAPPRVSESQSGTSAGKRTPTAARTTTTTPKQTGSSSKIYTVQEGDILSTVAAKTGVPVERLRELNPELDANSMTVGQRIRLADDAPQTP